MTKTLRCVVVLVTLAVVGVPAGLYLSAADDKKDKDKGVATFEVYKDKGDEFRFRFKDSDGDHVAISGKGYKTKAECLKVIDAIKKDAPKAKVEDETK